jgi:hypothetical protein
MHMTKTYLKPAIIILLFATTILALGAKGCLGWRDKDDDTSSGSSGPSPYTFYGQVINNQTGQPLTNKKISFYPDTGIEPQYDDAQLLADYMYTTWQTLTPKATPDTTTDANGYFYANLPDGTYNMVISGSGREDEMEIVVNTAGGAKRRDSEVNENILSDNFNAEGHILYMGKFEKQDENDVINGNKYTAGQSVRFVMFGVNNGTTDQTITFCVQDHTSIGGPTAPIIYTGSITDTNETLTVLAGQKTNKDFDWTIPAGLTTGRYDIHVVWNSEVWHKIGNFFVIADSDPPQINIWADNGTVTFTNQPLPVGYWAGDNATPGTIPGKVVAMQVISGIPNMSILVNIDKDIATDGPDADVIVDNDVDITAFGGTQQTNLTYDQSGYYTARFTAVDPSGNNASKDMNISVFITEDEADAIATPFYNSYCTLNGSFGPLQYDHWGYIAKSAPDVNASFDMYSDPDIVGGRDLGHEYLTPADGLNETEINALQAAENTCGPEYVKVINLATSTEFCEQLYDYLNWVDTSCVDWCALPVKATVCGE